METLTTVGGGGELRHYFDLAIESDFKPSPVPWVSVSSCEESVCPAWLLTVPWLDYSGTI